MRRRSRLRRFLWTAVTLTLVLGTGYAYITRPSALRARLISLLQKFDLRVVRIGKISFSPFAGLVVLDLRVAVGEESPLAGRAPIPDSPPLLQVPRAHVAVNPWALLLGEFRPRVINLATPEFRIIRPDTDTPGLQEWRGTGRLVTPREPPADLPNLKITNADIQVFAVKNDRLQLQRRWVVDGNGALLHGYGARPRAYVLRFHQVGGPISAANRQEEPLAEVRWQAGRLIAELNWVDLETAQALLPDRWTQFVRQSRLSGQARAQRCVLEHGRLASVELHFDDLEFHVPIEAELDEAPEDRFAHVTDLAGVLTYVAAEPREDGSVPHARGDVRLQVSGRMNGAATELSLDLSDAGFFPQESDDEDRRVTTLGIDGLEVADYELSLRVDQLALPTAARHPRFVRSERLPKGLRTVLRQYNAEGLVNLRLSVRGGTGDSLIGPGSVGETAGQRYQGELEAVGASCRYFRFPYAVEDIHGFVRFSNDGILLDGLNGRHGSGRIHADGRVTSTKSWTGFDLSFGGYNIATDESLFAALPSEYRQLWKDADPVGLCDVQTTLQRDDGSPEAGSRETSVRVDARLLAGSLVLLDGGQLESADGWIHIADGTVRLDDLQGYVEGAPVRVNGALTLEDEGTPDYGVHLEAASATLHRTSEVRDGRGQPVGEIRFEGVGDVWGQISSGKQDQNNHYAVHITGGSITGFDAGEPWSDARGWISLCGGEQRIRGLSASREDGRLEVSGVLPKELGLDAPIVIDLRAEDADLERLLRQLVPGRWANIRKALGLAGRGTLAARFHPRTEEGGPGRLAADIQLEGARMRPTPLPLDLREIAARVTLRGTGFDVHEATAAYGEQGRLAVSGHGGWEEGDLWSDIRVEGRDLALDAELVEAMPGPLASLLKRLAPRGQMHLTLDQVLLSGSEQCNWDVVGRVELNEAELDIGAPLTACDGQLNGACQIRPDGRMILDAEFTIDRGRLAARPIERWEGRLLRPPDVGQIKLEDVRGRLCDGEVVGSAVIDPETSSYALEFTLHDVSLDQFLLRDENSPSRNRQARLDGHVFVRGDTEDPTQRGGGGTLRIRGASLLHSPVTASVVQASRQQQRPISDEVERAELKFVWEGQELKLTEVDINSRDLRLKGMGTWNMQTDAIRMTLLGATPENALRLFPLTDLLESAGQELMQYRVEGTAAHPQVTIEPFHNLTEPLRKLLQGAKSQVQSDEFKVISSQ